MRQLPNLLLLFALGFSGICGAQDDAKPTQQEAAPTAPPASDQPAPKAADPTTTGQIRDTAKKLVTEAEAGAEKIAKQVDQNPQAKKAAAGILQPIYVIAEALAFPEFHWLAFALMVAGVVSYALQLMLGKLVVLLRMGFSVKEIASDAVSLAISIVGLVLTTQAAAENSTFTQSPAAVISATLVGAVSGFVLYLWGQSQELDAAAGRSRPMAPRKK